MSINNGLPDDLTAPCCCGHNSGSHIAAESENGKLRNVPADQTRCAFCGCLRFTPVPATWEVLTTDPLDDL